MILNCGRSAGSTLSIILSLLYRDEKPGPPLTGTYLSIPSCIDIRSVPDKYAPEFVAWEQNKDAPILNRGTLEFFRGMPKYQIKSHQLEVISNGCINSNFSSEPQGGPLLPSRMSSSVAYRISRPATRIFPSMWNGSFKRWRTSLGANIEGRVWS